MPQPQQVYGTLLFLKRKRHPYAMWVPDAPELDTAKAHQVPAPRPEVRQGRRQEGAVKAARQGRTRFHVTLSGVRKNVEIHEHHML